MHGVWLVEHGSMAERSMGRGLHGCHCCARATVVRLTCNGGLWSGQPQMRTGLASPARACQACLGQLHPHTVLHSLRSLTTLALRNFASHCSSALCGAHAIAGGGVCDSSLCMQLAQHLHTCNAWARQLSGVFTALHRLCLGGCRAPALAEAWHGQMIILALCTICVRSGCSFLSPGSALAGRFQASHTLGAAPSRRP
jgi:hypothetical protein